MVQRWWDFFLQIVLFNFQGGNKMGLVIIEITAVILVCFSGTGDQHLGVVYVSTRFLFSNDNKFVSNWCKPVLNTSFNANGSVMSLHHIVYILF